MRDISRKALARDAAWTLADGNCKGMAARWGAWERTYLAADAIDDRTRALLAPGQVCCLCPIVAECADLAQLSGYTGIAAGIGYRNGRPDTYRLRDPHQTRANTA